MYIPYGRQSINDDDIQAVVEVLKSDYLTMGPKIEEFEKCVAEYTNTKYAVAISNGTAALHAACFATGIGVNVHYIPVHKHPYYQENGYADVVCEKAEELYKHMISLPLYSDLTEGEQDYVIEVVKGVVK